MNAEHSVATPPDSPPLRRVGSRVLTFLGAVALALGVAASWSMVRAHTVETPKAVAERTVSAIINDDALGLLETVYPPQRQALLDDGLPLLRQFNRLQVTSGRLSIGTRGDKSRIRSRSDIGDITNVSRDLVLVTVRSKVGEPNPLQRWPGGSWIGAVLSEASKDPQYAFRRTGTRWYFSPQDSLAQGLQRRLAPGSSKAKVKPLSVVSTGAERPEIAVEQFLSAASDLNLPSALSMLDPDDVEAWQNTPALIEAWGLELDRFRRQYEISIEDAIHDITMENGGDRAVIGMQAPLVNFSLTEQGAAPFRVVFKSPCVVVTSGTTKKRCNRDIVRFGQQFGLISDLPKAQKQVETFLRDHGTSLRAGVGIVVVRRDGRWYVSPSRTILRNGSSFLATLSPAQYRSVVRQLTEAAATVGKLTR